MGRPPSGPNPEPVKRQVARWNSQIAVHAKETAQLPKTLAEHEPPSAPAKPAKRVKVENPDKAEQIKSRPEDPLLDHCIDIANQHIQKSREEDGKAFPSLPVDPNLTPMPSSLVYYSNSQPLLQYGDAILNQHLRESGLKMELIDPDVAERQQQEDIARRAREREENPLADIARFSVPLKPFTGNDVKERLMSMFTAGNKNMTRRWEDSQSVPAVKKPEISRYHIANMLWLHNELRPRFPMCINAVQGLCQAQLVLQHPLAPNAGMMAYLSPQDYLFVLHGTPLPNNVACTEESLRNLPYSNLCEFCYRAFVHAKVENIKLEGHHAEVEIPTRYYAVGASEYSREGMMQQFSLQNILYSHGIIGNMRLWNTSDFIAVMGLLAESGEISTVITVKEYNDTEPTGNWIAGWVERGPFYQLNEMAFLEVGQVDPYQQTIFGTARELTVEAVLQDHFKKRAGSQFPDYSHIFENLLNCIANPDYLSLSKYTPKNPEKNPWRRFCAHPYESPPPLEGYRIYYILLMKINTLYALYSSKKMKALFSDAFRQRIKVYIYSYHPLITHICESRKYSDADLLQPTFVSHKLGLKLSPLIAFYPFPARSNRATDMTFVKHFTTIYLRDTPLEFCQKHYRTQRSLYNLKPLYTPSSEFPVPEKLDSALFNSMLEKLEYVVENARKHFEQQKKRFSTYGLRLSWQNPLSRRRRDVEGKTTETQRKSELLSRFKQVDSTLAKNFDQLHAWAAPREELYELLLCKFGAKVFCEFSDTLNWLAEEQNLANVISSLNCFSGMLGAKLDAELVITPTHINGRPWSQHLILLACLIRAYVLEQLHNLELIEHKALRYQLILLRNSHLGLFRHIVCTPSQLLTDVSLMEVSGTATLSLLDHFYPHSIREIHQGSLPNYGNSLFYVNFFCDGGMDAYPWPKSQYKKPDRACDLREFSFMLYSFIGSSTFYRNLLLELELSLKGLYEHCTVRPNFGSTVSLDELFDHASEPHMKPVISQFIVNHEALVRNATSESLCYLLTKMPSLQAKLTEVYGDRFAWRAFANMDMARECFSRTQNFQRIDDVVFKTVNLLRHRKVFRLAETNFVVWLCDLFKKANERRNKKLRQQLPDEAAVSSELAVIIQLFVTGYADSTIDVRDLAVIQLNPTTLETLARLNESFISHVSKNYGYSEKVAALSNDELIDLVLSLEPSQYCIAHRFLTLLRDSRSVRCTKITNQYLLEQQSAQLQKNAAAAKQPAVPINAIRLAYCPACKNVKISWAARVDTPSVGYEDIAYNVEEGIFVCSKKRHRFEEVDSAILEELLAEERRRQISMGQNYNPESKEAKTILRKAAAELRRHDREMLRADCSKTEILTLPLFGNLVEMDMCKVPGAKRISNSQQAGSIKTAPMPGYWLTPCCGIPYSYNDANRYPGGYACGACSEASIAAATFKMIFCNCCRTEPSSYSLPMVYDDLYTMTLRRIVICSACTTRLRNVPLEYKSWQAIMTCIDDDSQINTLLIYASSFSSVSIFCFLLGCSASFLDATTGFNFSNCFCSFSSSWNVARLVMGCWQTESANSQPVSQVMAFISISTLIFSSVIVLLG